MNKLRNLSVPLLYSRGRTPPIKTNNSLSLLRLTVAPKRFSTEDATIVSTDKSTDALEQTTNRSLPWSKSQRTRKDALVGPRFEQTDLEAQASVQLTLLYIHTTAKTSGGNRVNCRRTNTLRGRSNCRVSRRRGSARSSTNIHKFGELYLH
ncbi:14472_t:CDS:2 [Acaulospora morrowiae]|uniref:14472_t:CDS:1 n=1 Tax=Acaulospora morrowiae TaxID=94023 RepID=A0A9N8WG07_9GLOM|nr:14472_t:CDS:2 [Acaulospora morrowiae]